MRRLSFLLALIALASAILVATGDDVEGKTRRRKLRTRAHPAAAAVSGRPVAKRPARRARTPGGAHADTPTSPDLIPRRLMIVGFDGRGAQAARAAAANALRPVASMRVVPLRPADAMRLGTEYGREKTAGLARRLNLTAVLYGTIKQTNREVRLSLLLANGEDGRIVGELTFEARTLGALRAKLKARLWSQLGRLIDQAASPGRPESGETPVAEAEPGTTAGGELPATPPERQPPRPRTAGEVPEIRPPQPRPAGEASETSPIGTEAGPVAPPGEGQGEAEGDGEASAEPPTVEAHERRPGPDEPGTDEIPALQAHGPPPTDRCSIAELSPGAGVMARRFNYRAEQRGALRGYALFRAPVGRIEGTLYPFAGGSCRVSTGFGLRAAYDRLGPVSSQVANRELGTQGSAYQVELVLRIVTGRLTLQPALGYLARQYRVDGDVVPAADYRAVGGGLDAELRGRYLFFALGASARRIMGAGTLGTADWFPNWSGYAASAHVQAGVAATDWMDIVVGGSAEYELFNFIVDPNAPNPNGVAGGAYDLYLQGTLSIRFRLGRGTGPGTRTGSGGVGSSARAARRTPDGALSSR
jgi:hypothetical protein